MKSRILAGLEKTEQESLDKDWETSRRLRRRMVDLLQKDVDAIHASMRDNETFNSPSWAYEQAAKIGEVKALMKIISLFS